MSAQENDAENFDSELINDNENADLEEASLEDIFSEELLAESEADSEESLETELENEKERFADLEAKLAEAQDNFLRKAADFENYRKRMNMEKQRAIEFANESLLLDLIPVIDDFERAIQAAQASELAVDAKAMLDGITMIEKQLLSLLETKWGLKRLNSTGEAFNPDCHEAIMMEKSPDVKEAVVKEEFLKAYMLKDRLIRAAKVNVLMPEDDI